MTCLLPVTKAYNKDSNTNQNNSCSCCWDRQDPWQIHTKDCSIYDTVYTDSRWNKNVWLYSCILRKAITHYPLTQNQIRRIIYMKYIDMVYVFFITAFDFIDTYVPMWKKAIDLSSKFTFVLTNINDKSNFFFLLGTNFSRYKTKAVKVH